LPLPIIKVLVAVSIIPLQLFRLSYTGLLLDTFIFISLDPLNALLPILVTLPGIVIEVNEVQSLNALSLILLIPLDRVTDIKPLQPSNAS
jgi:hypothetical protein